MPPDMAYIVTDQNGNYRNHYHRHSDGVNSGDDALKAYADEFGERTTGWAVEVVPPTNLEARLAVIQRGSDT